VSSIASFLFCYADATTDAGCQTWLIITLSVVVVAVFCLTTVAVHVILVYRCQRKMATSSRELFYRVSCDKVQTSDHLCVKQISHIIFIYLLWTSYRV